MKRRVTLLKTLFGTFSVKDKLGEGGTGTVYRCTDEEGVDHAVKVLDPAKATASKLRRFRNEVMFGFRNSHPNILTIEDHGVSENGPFYIMPLYATTLRVILTEPLAADSGLRVFGGILDGLEAAHLRGVVHRDLKPENILLDNSGRPVVGDWGAAAFQEDQLFIAAETGKHERLANFLYSAPEQRRRGVTAGPPADIFAAGLILHEMFTGEVLQGTGARRIRDIAPQYGFLDDLVDEMLRQDPSKRPPSVDAVKLRLQENKILFASRQKLDGLNRERVVPVTTSDDLLVRDPVRVVGRDYDADAESLRLTLNHKVNAEWRRELNNVGGAFYFDGSAPSARKVRWQHRHHSNPSCPCQ